jgi:hypothetical protein
MTRILFVAAALAAAIGLTLVYGFSPAEAGFPWIDKP